jgi:MFS family permease
LSDPEALYRQQVLADLPRNFSAHLLHGMLGQTGFRLFSTPTFLPAFILLLSGGSEFAVGLALALQAFGSALTPVLGAWLIEHRQRVLPVGFVTGAAMRLMVLGVALAGMLLQPPWALWLVYLFLALFGLLAGCQAVIFNVLLAKVIPVTNRGKLVGLRNFLAGVTTALVAWYGGHHLLGETPAADGYAWMFIIAFVMTSVGLACLLAVREPQPPTTLGRSSLAQRLRSIPGFMRDDPAFSRYVQARALTTLGRMALPFYILYAGQEIGLSGQTLATLTIAFTVTATVSTIGWGLLADQRGFRLTLLLSVGLWLGVTVLLLVSRDYLLVVVIFAALGASQEGFRIASINLALEFGHRDQIPLRLAVANSAAELAGAVAPLLGGIVAALLGYGAVFVLTALLLAVGATQLLLLVPEPRGRQA